jgi:lysozyme
MEKFIQAILSLLQSILSGLATSTTKKNGGASQGLSGTPTGIKNVELIKESEGLRLKAYLPTPNDVYTIGYGHTKTAEKGMVITLAGADALLLHDLAWVETAIDTYVQVPLNQNQYDALSSFIYNVGGTAFRKSTLLKKLNQNDYNGAANELLRWDKQKGKVLRGLTKRRQLEKDLFLS